MKNHFFILINVLFLKVFCNAQDAWDDRDIEYVFDSVNVISGEYTEAQNDLCLSGPEPFILRRHHTRDDRFLYGWHCNLPNLLNKPMPGDAGQFTDTQRISYEYDQINRLKSVKHSDLSGENVYNWMDIQYHEGPQPQCIIQTLDGNHITYRFLNQYLIAEVFSSQQPSVAYSYQPHPSGDGYVIDRRTLPEGRYVENEYYEKGHPYAGKVKVQKGPVGCDSTSIVKNRFVYHEGFTEVYDAQDFKTIYRFSRGKLTAVENYDRDGQLCRSEKLEWIFTGSEKTPRLKVRYVSDEQGYILAARSFIYDAQGRLTKDTQWGNLSGLCTKSIEIEKEGLLVNNGIEFYSVSYEYANGLLSCMTEDNGKKVLYRYWPNSSNVYAKLSSLQGKIFFREFYFYNNSGQVIKVCRDDGSSEKDEDLNHVSERHIKNISYRKEHPALGLPESIEESYLNLSSGQELLVRKIINHYNQQAKIIRQDVYDSNNCFQYSISNEYDERGRLATASDVNDGYIEKKYDLNNNLLKTTSIDAKGLFQEISHSYDFANRLISTESFDKDNNPRKIHFQYDLNGNKIAFIDECGNKTAYEYDCLGRETKVIFPEVFDEGLNAIRPTLKKKYDALNRIIAQTDARGFSTYTQYNARGKPIEVIHPDQRIERFIYNLDGSLKIYTDAFGCRTVYHRDPFGRVLQTEIFDRTGVLVKETKFIHNAFHLLQAKDSSGRKIRYGYDDAGRLCSIEQLIDGKKDKRITYEYNSLGQQTVVKEWFGKNLQDFIATIKEFAVGGVLKSTRVENSEGTLQKFISCEEAGLGSVEHEDFALNSLGQQVIEKTVVDPSGNVAVTLFDALKRPVKMTKKNALGDVIGIQEMCWDVNNHKVRETHYIDSEEAISTIWKYDSNDRLIQISEGFGTDHPKTTRYNYNEYGQLTTILKSDGIEIYYQYTSLGDISRLHSSDGTVDYSFAYDQDRRATKIFDNIHHTMTLRSYSADGFLLDEQQGNNLATCRKYDPLNRCIELKLSDSSLISYEYNGSFLKEIHRQSSENVYKHLYEDRNADGQVLIQQFALNGGEQTSTFDTRGRLARISTPYWSEDVSYSDDGANTINRIHIQDASGIYTNEFSYDAQDQLTSENGYFNHSFSYNWLGQHENSLNQLTRKNFDLNGNLKEKFVKNEKLSLEYDALNRMTALHKENGEVYRYVYDAFHRRLSKTCYGPSGKKLWEQKYLYDGLKEIGAVNESGEITELRVLGEGLGAEIGSAIAMEFAGKVFIPIHDHRGSVCCLVDAENAAVIEKVQYSAFGEEDAGNSKLINPWRFSSKRCDEESGLIYFGKRYYDPSAQQWTTQDPLRSIEGPNPYAFASNNPLSRIDPYGLFSFSNLWQSLYSRAASIGQEISSLFFTANTFINNHLSLEHNFRSKIEDPALAIFSKDMLSVFGFYKDKQEMGTFGQGEANDKVRITLINGILNARYYLLDTVEMVSDFHGGNNIHYIFRPTEGWTWDLFKSVLVKCGWVSPQAKQLAARWRELIAEMGGVNGGGKIIHYAHSLGAVDTFLAKSLLSPEELSMIQVYTFGSPLLFGPGGFQSVTNFVSKGDGICLLDPVSYFQSIGNPPDHISFLPSSWAIPLIDHQLNFPAYQSILESLGRQFLDLYACGA